MFSVGKGEGSRANGYWQRVLRPSLHYVTVEETNSCAVVVVVVVVEKFRVELRKKGSFCFSAFIVETQADFGHVIQHHVI